MSNTSNTDVKYYLNQAGVEYLKGSYNFRSLGFEPIVGKEIYVSSSFVEKNNDCDALILVYQCYFGESTFELFEIELDKVDLTEKPKVEMVLPLVSIEKPEEKKADNMYTVMGKELGELVDSKQLAYGNSVDQAYKVVQAFMSPYKNSNGTYTIPESLLQHLLLQVRIIDKQNRIFNNPDGDLMSESPYGDLAGYGLLGKNMSESM